MNLGKTKWLLIVLLGLTLGLAASAVYVQVFKPKLDYTIEPEPITVSYVDEALDLGVLVRNASYVYDDTDVTAINVASPCTLTVNFNSVNSTHFEAFTVELWNRTATPYVFVDSFNMTSGPCTVNVAEPTELGYLLDFTVAEYAPYGDAGTVTLEVTFTEP